MTIVGLIQLGQFHTEIIGGVISAFLRPNVSIRVYTPKYRASFVPYYKRIFKDNDVKWVYNDKYTMDMLKEKIERECDLYVFLTGYDYEEFETDPSRTLLINHITDDIKEYQSWDTCGQLGLSPVFKPERIRHFLNVFEGKKYEKNPKSLDLCVVGLTNPENKDLKKLVELMKQIDRNNNRILGKKVKFHIINYYDLPEEFELYQRSGLIKTYIDSTANTTMNVIGKSDYAMLITRKNSSYHRKQLSGVIPLAISVGTPLICDKHIAKIYGMSRLSVTYDFESDYLMKGIQSALKKDYSKLVYNTISFRDRLIKKNKSFRFPCLKSPRRNHATRLKRK
jgi:hypothetical protein